MHDCVKIAIEKVLGFEVPLPKVDRGYTSPEVAKALLPLGYGLTVYENVVEVEMPTKIEHVIKIAHRPAFSRIKKKLLPFRVVAMDTVTIDDLVPWTDCLVEIPRHALAYVDGKYYNGDQVVTTSEKILSIWVPHKLI